MKEKPPLRPVMGAIPSEEELLKTLDEHHEEPGFRLRGSHPFIKLFLTICLAAPVAAYLVLLVVSRFGPPAGFQPNQAPESAHNANLPVLMEGLAKSNEKIAEAISAQTAAMEKSTIAMSEAMMAQQPPALMAETLSAQSAKPGVTVEGPKVIVVKVPSNEPFDLTYEKGKILELCGVDLDDPISGPEAFSKAANVEVLKEVIHSFDIILASSRNSKEVSAFIKSNALAGRKYAIEQLKKGK